MSVFIIEHVFKDYVTDKKVSHVLKDINLRLPDRGLVSIVGKSGSGKSTLLNLMMGIEKPTKGRILFMHKDTSKFNDRKFSKFHLHGVSLIFQHYNLFNDQTALRNTMVPLLMKGYSRQKAKAVCLEMFKKFKLEQLAYRNVDCLSGGEKQRIAIIRSLVTKPKAILCDEPTGALDYQNGIEIVKILKDISKTTLVVMVSHNNELVNRFSDQILTIKDGEIISNISTLNDHFSNKYENEKVSYSSKWARKFLFSNLKKNIKKNLFSIVACTISFLAILLSIGFINGSSSSQDEALSKNLASQFSTISKTEFIELENSPLQYQKSTRPSLALIDEVIGDLEGIQVEENISYLISDFATCSFNKKQIMNFSMVPIYDVSLNSFDYDLLFKGETINESFEEIIVNEEFEKILGGDALGKEIVISSNATVTFSTGEQSQPFIKDTFVYAKKFLIRGIVHEFSFLNTPKIYYSYNGAKSFLKSEIMRNSSTFLGKTITFFEYLKNCKEDDIVCSYSYYLFVKGKNQITKLFEKIDELAKGENKIQISSNAYDVKETYSTFISSFSFSLIIFVAIAFLGVNFILGMISLSTFIENRKDTAIMTCLGARNNTIQNLYLSENFIIIFTSFLIGTICSLPLMICINKILASRFSLSNLILIPYKFYFGIPFGLLLFTLSVAILCSSIFTLIPMNIYRKFSLAEELRDE